MMIFGRCFDDELYRSPALAEHLANYALGDGGEGHFWAVVMRTGGELVSIRSNPFTAPPDEPQRVFAQDMCRALNAQIHHHGAWIVAWTHPRLDGRLVLPLTGWRYDRWHFVWLDADGDPQFHVDNDEPFAETVGAGMAHWLGQAEEAWQRADMMIHGVLDVQPHQRFMAAKGERRPQPPHPRGRT